MNIWLIVKEVGIKKFIEAGIKEIYRKVYRGTFLGSYAQDKEDLVMEKLLPKIGRYLEIGGYHPSKLSNTYRFYKNGWSGVVVEPNPDIKSLFGKIRPRDKFINMGISENGGYLKYYKYLIPALNSFIKLDNGYKIVSIENIETKIITDIVNEDFDFLSLDTEGFDKMILKNWPWGKFKPKVICVETDKITVDKILTQQGYKLKFQNKFNSIYGY